MTRLHAASWKVLLSHAFDIMDAAPPTMGAPLRRWSLGGGTMLMRAYRHRVSKDVDIFLSDAQWLGYLTPRLNEVAEGKTSEYVEQAGFIKLYFPEGEVDFVVATPLTKDPFTLQTILDRTVCVETPTEIVAKKLKHRASQFRARDVFDLACVLEAGPDTLRPLQGIVAEARASLLRRIETQESSLREDFAALDVLDYRPSYDHAVNAIRAFLTAVGPPPRPVSP